MRLNYDTFTGRRSAFVTVAACLILLSWVAFAVFSRQLADLLAPVLPGRARLTAGLLLIQNGLVVVSILIAGLLTERKYTMKEKFGLTFEKGYSMQFFLPIFILPIFILAMLVTFGAQIGLNALLKHVGHEPKEQSMVEFFRTLKPLAFVCFSMSSGKTCCRTSCN